MNVRTRTSYPNRIDLDRFFNSFYPSRVNIHNKQFAQPKVDIVEQDNSYQLIAELPGIDKENIQINVEDSMLTISADSESSSEDAKENTPNFLRKERYLGKYQRSFNLGDEIDQNSIKASFNNGLLILDIAKVKEETPKARQIEIH